MTGRLQFLLVTTAVVVIASLAATVGAFFIESRQERARAEALDG